MCRMWVGSICCVWVGSMFGGEVVVCMNCGMCVGSVGVEYG